MQFLKSMYSVAKQRVYFISMKGTSAYHVDLIATRKSQDSQEIVDLSWKGKPSCFPRLFTLQENIYLTH